MRAFQELRARIGGLGHGGRAPVGLRINELAQHGRLAAPIVIGRSHRHAGAAAASNRNTEGMRGRGHAIGGSRLLGTLLDNDFSTGSWRAPAAGPARGTPSRYTTGTARAVPAAEWELAAGLGPPGSMNGVWKT